MACEVTASVTSGLGGARIAPLPETRRHEFRPFGAQVCSHGRGPSLFSPIEARMLPNRMFSRPSLKSVVLIHVRQRVVRPTGRERSNSPPEPGAWPLRDRRPWQPSCAPPGGQEHATQVRLPGRWNEPGAPGSTAIPADGNPSVALRADGPEGQRTLPGAQRSKPLEALVSPPLPPSGRTKRIGRRVNSG